ncbi:MAG: (Fe-S)-binding protein, partial [Promethearchaeota archaeon]
EIANKSNINLTVSPDEWCCGSINLRTGTEALFKEYANYNNQVFKNSEIEKIVTTCSGCYKTLSQDYPKYLDNWNFQVLHSIEMIDEAINQGNLKIRDKIKGIITYHDPCHLGRHSGIYDAPRNVIDAIKKDEFVEMRRNRKYSYCCGAGGGVKSAFPDLALDIALDRIKEAEETGAEYLTSTCPFCLNNLREASTILKTHLKVVDLLELVKKVI